MSEVPPGTVNRQRPHKWDYRPPRYSRDDPLDRLPVGDELKAELAEVIDDRLGSGERHTHPKKGGCPDCAEAAADAVVRYLERNTRVIQSDALAPDEHERARRAIQAMPYLGSRRYLRLKGDLAIHPTYPTVEDLLTDLETIRDAVQALDKRERDRDAELRTYRAWREAVQDLATEVLEVYDRLDESPASGDPRKENDG